jgi:hypothetical protein
MCSVVVWRSLASCTARCSHGMGCCFCEWGVSTIIRNSHETPPPLPPASSCSCPPSKHRKQSSRDGQCLVPSRWRTRSILDRWRFFSSLASTLSAFIEHSYHVGKYHSYSQSRLAPRGGLSVFQVGTAVSSFHKGGNNVVVVVANSDNLIKSHSNNKNSHNMCATRTITFSLQPSKGGCKNHRFSSHGVSNKTDRIKSCKQ